MLNPLCLNLLNYYNIPLADSKFNISLFLLSISFLRFKVKLFSIFYVYYLFKLIKY